MVWSIRQAQSAARVRRVIVSTDDDDIAAVADREGCGVFRRSSATASDTAPSEWALVEVLEAQEDRPELTVFLQATSPLRGPDDIDNAVGMLEGTGADSLFSARRVEGYIWRHTLDTGLVPLHGRRVPRQQRTDTVWEENGSLYVFRTALFLLERTRHCGRSVVYEMDPLDSYQIDELDDVTRLLNIMSTRTHHANHHAAACS